MKVPAKFAYHVRECLFDDYTLSTGEQVKGQSFSFILTSLRREYGWRMPGGFYDHVEILEAAGFKVLRGRGRRIYHGGKYGLGKECDVVCE